MSILPAENPLRDIRVISFDIDGTLTFMEEAVSRANKCMFDYAKEHYPKIQLKSQNEISDILTETIINNGHCYNIGEVRRRIINSFVVDAGYDANVTLELFQVWRNERKKTTLIPYAKELLTLLHDHGFTLALITNGTSSMEVHKELNEFFIALINPDLCNASKPDVKPFQKLMEICENNCVSQYMHVGDDYSSDILGAIHAGWKSVFITNNLPYTITHKNPTIQVSSLKELYEYFKTHLEASN